MTTLIMLTLLVFGIQNDEEYHDLRFKFVEGDTWHHETNAKIGEVVVGRPGENVSHMRMNLSENTARVRPDGKAEVIIKFDNVLFEVGGKEIEVPEPQNEIFSVPIKTVVTPEGKVEEFAPLEALKPETKQMLELFKQMGGGGNSVSLPGKPVRVGDSWFREDPTTMDVGGQQIDVIMKNHYTLEGLGEVEGKPCFIIRMKGEGEIFYDQGEGGSSVLNINNVMKLDRESCHLLSIDSNFKLDFKKAREDGTELHAQVSMEMQTISKRVSGVQ